ncbi:hypothetical protein SCAR479_11678 [Seiridium cardinale]|uniref:Uncharacterized protein n=1 Tax=Seiridium cardinale TaxID=138064 RepID=A0ABR2XD60_9PEZI
MTPTRNGRVFEVRVSIDHQAIDHHGLDISKVDSDGKLFELIWDRYNTSRGRGVRRLVLWPRNVHFVMFSISKGQFGAGIHEEPEEYPPEEEVARKR